MILAKSEIYVIGHRNLKLVFLPGKFSANLEEIITLKINKTNSWRIITICKNTLSVYIIYVYVTFIHKFLSYISSQIIIIFFTVCARHYFTY